MWLNRCYQYQLCMMKEARRYSWKVYVSCKGVITLKGKIDYAKGLWRVPIGSTKNSQNTKRGVTKHSENIAAISIKDASANKELVRFLYATSFYHIKSTCIVAIKKLKLHKISRTNRISIQPKFTIWDTNNAKSPTSKKIWHNINHIKIYNGKSSPRTDSTWKILQSSQLDALGVSRLDWKIPGII